MSDRHPDDQLIDALKAHDLAGVEAAIAAGASLDRDLFSDYMPLPAAIAAGFLEGVDLLLARGVDLLAGQRGYGTPHLIPALRAASTAPLGIQRRIAEALFTVDMPPVQRLMTFAGWATLFEAEPAWLARAIAAADDLDERIGRVSPLCWAANHGAPGAVKALLDAGADATREFGGNPDPLGYCAYNQAHWGAIYDLLRAAGLPQRRFQAEAGVLARNVGFLERLLAEAPRVDGLTKMLFMTAASRGEVEVAQTAIDAGLACDPGTMEAAISSGHLALVDALIAAGADVNQAAASTGQTPLMYAVGGRKAAIIARLIEAGADVNAETPPPHRYARSALHTALRRRDWASAQQLLEAGAAVPPDLRDAYVATAEVSGDPALIERMRAAPERAERAVDLGDPAQVPGSLQALARAVAAGEVAAGGFGWQPFSQWTGSYAPIAELPGRPSVVAGLPAASGGRLVNTPLGLTLELVPRALAWAVPVEPAPDEVALLLARFAGQRDGTRVRRAGYLGMVGALREVEDHLTMSPWIDRVPLQLSGPGGERCRFRAAFSGAIIEIVAQPALALHGASPMIAIVDGVPDPWSAEAIARRNRRTGQHTPIDVPLDAVAGLEPAPMIGQADLTEMLGRNPDDPRAFRDALPNVWAHAMLGDPDAPAPHLRDFLEHPGSAVRFAAFTLAYGWQATEVMDAFRAREADPRAREMMNTPALDDGP